MSDPGARPVTLCVTARIPPEGVALFRAYENTVLALLGDHGGRLERRCATADGTFEMHLVWFASCTALAAYRADPRRAAAAHLLAGSHALITVEAVEDV